MNILLCIRCILQLFKMLGIRKEHLPGKGVKCQILIIRPEYKIFLLVKQRDETSVLQQ